MEEKLSIIENNMKNDPENLDIIEEYSSIIEQFNNI
jgi:hypothetical protein